MSQEEVFSTATAKLVLEMQSRDELYRPVLDLLRVLTQEVGIDWAESVVQQALTQNNSFRFVAVLE